MDTLRDTQLSGRALRLEQRTATKYQRTVSVTDEHDNKNYYTSANTDKPGMATEYVSAWKPPSSQPVPDSFAAPAFGGTNTDADTWLAHCHRYSCRLVWDIVWRCEGKLEYFTGEFDVIFRESPFDYVFAEETVFTRVQRPKEKVSDYIAQMQKLAKRVLGLEDVILSWVISRGLRPQIKANVIVQKGEINSVADTLVLAKLAESAGLGEDDDPAGVMNQLMDEVRAGREEMQQLTASIKRMSVSMAHLRSRLQNVVKQECRFQSRIKPVATFRRTADLFQRRTWFSRPVESLQLKC